MSTNIVPISDLRRKASQVVQGVRTHKEAIYITQHGRPAAVLVNYETYEAMLKELHNLREKSEKREAVAHPKGALFALEELAQDFGVDDFAEQHDHYLYGVEKS